MPPPPTPASRRVVPDTRWRDTLIAVAVAAVIFGLIGYAVFYFTRQAHSTGQQEGVIVRREFIARPESQVSVGKDGLHTRQIAGEYIFHVRPAHAAGPEYRVPVDQPTYDAHREGDAFYFILPPVP